ncbi:MAG: serine--tRNA ligase, partial [Bacteroidales bacterium]|nr:serine--tRNA ligase [Bacteroidales bacterium]
MLTLKMLRDDPEMVISRLAVKNFEARPIVEKIIALDTSRRNLQTESDALLAQQKQYAARIGGLMKEGKKEEAEQVKKEVAVLKARSNELLAQAEENNKELEANLVLLPNLPYKLVPEGKGAEDNLVVKMGGEDPCLPEGALPHWELAKKYDIIDFDLGVKLTGAGFPVYKGKGAKLQRALINFFLDRNTAAGYKEVEPPVMVNAASGFGTGQLPDKEAQMYYVGLDDFYLVPTAEVPVTNIFRDVILENGQCPQKMTAYTPCFRREAGSYGKDVRGLNRLHQFDKVEIVRVEKPEDSYAALDEMIAHVESLVNALGLRYRILRLCGGDMSFTSAITYDFELWSAAQGRWLEISSVSNFETYQANRLHLRYRDEAGKTQLAHTL